MAILIVPGRLPDGSNDLYALVERLADEGDDTRVILPKSAIAVGEDLQARGAHIAFGDPDADLVERAAQNARTLVLMEAPDPVQEIIEASRSAGVDRVVACYAKVSSNLREAVVTSVMDYVLIERGRRGFLGRGPASEMVAAAIDAADDLAGEPRLELDLRDEGALAALGLSRET